MVVGAYSLVSSDTQLSPNSCKAGVLRKTLPKAGQQVKGSKRREWSPMGSFFT